MSNTTHLTFGGEGGFAVALDPNAYSRLTKERFILIGEDDYRDALYAPHGWVIVGGAHLVWATTPGNGRSSRLVAATRKARDFGVLPQIALQVTKEAGRTVTYDAETRKAG